MSCTATSAVHTQADPPNERPMNLRLRAFRAVDEPATCARFVAGHRQALQAYRIGKLTSADQAWMVNPDVYVLVVEDLEEGTMLGGIRVHRTNHRYPLPTEDAVGQLELRLGDTIRADQRHGAGEICGLWRSPQAAILWGMVPELAVSAIAMAGPLGARRAWGLAPTHTLRFWQRLGYRIDTSLGQDGGFAYPDDRYVSHLVRLDADRLTNTPLPVRHLIYDLRQRPAQTRQIEFPVGTAQVKYDLEVIHRGRRRPACA